MSSSLIAILLLLSPFSFAGWKSGTLKRVEELNEAHKNVGDGPLITAWGAWKRMQLFPSTKGEVIEVPTGHNRLGKVRAHLFASPLEGKRPLYIYFPGIFGEPGDGITDELMNKLERLEGSLLVVPNFLSEQWVLAYPLYKEDPVSVELAMVKDIWSYTIGRISPEKISEVHVIGESLGTLLATAWTAEKGQSPRPRSLTLLWPPLQLDHAMANLDSYVTSHTADWERCWPLKIVPLFLEHFVFSPVPAGLNKEDSRCLSSLGAIKGFREKLRDVLDKFASSNGLTIEPPDTFEEFFQRYRAPLNEMIQKKDKKIHLAHWIKKIKSEDPGFDLRIMSSRDDFLNIGLDWEETARELNLRPDEKVLFTWGGHSGPLAVKDFYLLLK